MRGALRSDEQQQTIDPVEDTRVVTAHAGIVAAYLRNYDRLRGLLLRGTGCASTAEDLSQTAFLRLLRTHSSDIANPEGYIARIGSNLAIDWQRAVQRGGYANEIPTDLPSEAPSAERVLLGRERLRLVLKIAESLPPRCREVFVLRKIEGLEQSEIAERLGISLNMVQKHLRKALEDIAAGLAEFE